MQLASGCAGDVQRDPGQGWRSCARFRAIGGIGCGGGRCSREKLAASRDGVQLLPRPLSVARPAPRNTHAFPHPTHGLQALRWITQTCVAFDGLCCVASTILAAPERSDTCAAPVAEDAPSSEGGSAPMHTDAPWEPAAPEEQPASMDMSGGDSGCVQPGGSLLDLLLQCDITLPRGPSVARHEGRQEAPRGCMCP